MFGIWKAEAETGFARSMTMLWMTCAISFPQFWEDKRPDLLPVQWSENDERRAMD